MTNIHEIKTLTININGSISQDLNRFIQESVQKILLKYFDVHFPSDQTLVIDKIHFDLGTLKGKFIKEEFEVRLSYLIHTQLLKFFQSDEQAQQIGENISFTARENFIHYLQSGFNRGDDRALASLFEQLLNESVKYLKEILAVAGKSETTYKRLLFQLKFEQLERYWLHVYPDYYQRIRKINQSVMADMDTRFSLGKNNLAMLEILQKSTFFFMNTITSSMKLENEYVIFLKRHAADFQPHIPVDPAAYFDEFNKIISPEGKLSVKSADAILVDALIFYMETGRLTGVLYNGHGIGRMQSLPREQLLRLIKQLSFTTARLGVQVNRLLSILTISELDVVLLEIQRNASIKFATRITRLFYIRLIMNAAFAEDIIRLGRALIGDYVVSSTAEEVHLLEEFIKLISAKQGITKVDVIRKIGQQLQASYHHEAMSLKKRLSIIEKVKDVVESPPHHMGDLVGLYLNYLRTGIWSLTNISPQELLQQLWAASQDPLSAQLNKHLDLQVVWLRLIYQNPIEIVVSILSVVFKDDPHLMLLMNKLEQERATTHDESIHRAWLESFVIVKSQLGNGDQEQFPFLLNQRIVEQRAFINKKNANTDFLIGQQHEPEQEENMEWYVTSVIHFLKFKRHLYHAVEHDGLLLALNKIATRWPQELIDQLRKEADIKQLLSNIFDELPEGERDSWFKRLAPANRNQLDEVVELLSSKHKIDRSKIYASWLVITIFNTGVLDPIRILALLRNEYGIVEASEKWTDEQVKLQVNAHLEDALELITQIIQTGKFSAESTTQSAHELVELLKSLAQSNPEQLKDLFQNQLRNRDNIENLLGILHYDRFLEILNELNPAALTILERLVNLQLVAHQPLGSRNALTSYFYQKYIIALYSLHTYSAAQLTFSVLQEVAADFGLSSSDYLLILKEHPTPINNEFIQQLSSSQELKGQSADQHDIDMLIHSMLYGENPWWAANQLTGNEESIALMIDHRALTLLKREPGKTLQAIQESGESQTIYHRIVALLTQHQYVELIVAIAPKIDDAIRRLNKLLSSRKYLINQKAWRTFVLEYIATNKIVDDRTFMTNAVSYLAIALKINPEKLKLEFSEWGEQTTSAESKRPSLSDTASVIVHYLKTGSLPYGILASINSRTAWINYIEEQLRDGQEEPRRSLIATLHEARVMDRIVKHESDAFMNLLIGVLYPNAEQELLLLKTNVAQVFHDHWPSISFHSWQQVVHRSLLEAFLKNNDAEPSLEKWIVHLMQSVKSDLGVTTMPDPIELQRYGFSSATINAFVDAELVGKKDSPSDKEAFQTALIHYLKTGQLSTDYLPDITNQSSWEERLKREAQYVNLGLRSLLINVFADPVVVTRVVRNESESLVTILIRLLYPDDHKNLNVYQQKFEKFFSDNFSTILANSWRERFYFTLLERSAIIASTEKLIVLFLNKVHKELVTIFPLETAWLEQLGFDRTLISELIHSKIAITKSHDLTDAVWHYLKTGSVPDERLSDLPNPSAIVSWLEQRSVKDNQEFRNLIFNSMADGAVQLRLIRNESEQLLDAVVDVLFPSESRKLEEYKKNLIEFIRDNFSSVSTATLNALFYQFLLNKSNERESAEHLVVNFMLSIKSSLDLEYETEVLQAYGFPISMIQKLVLTGSESADDAEIIDSQLEELGLRFSQAIHYYLKTGLIPVHLLDDVENSSDLEQQLKQQLSKESHSLRKVISKAIAEEKIRLRVVREEHESMLSLLYSVFYPNQLRALKSWRDGVTRFIHDQDSSIPISRLNQVFHLSLFESAVSSMPTNLKAEELMIQFITKAIDLFNLSVEENETELKRYGFNSKLLRAITQSGVIGIRKNSERSNQKVLNQLVSGVQYYLRTGLLAADLLPTIKTQAELVHVLRRQFASGNDSLRASILEALRDQHVRSRLIQNESNSFLFVLLRALMPDELKNLEHDQLIASQFILDHSSSGSLVLLDKLFFTLVLDEVGEHQSIRLSAEQWIVMFMSKATVRFNVKWQLIPEELQRYGFRQQLIDSLTKSGIASMAATTDTTREIVEDDEIVRASDWNITHDIDFLLHLILEREIPWWAIERMAMNDDSIDRIIEKLITQLLNHHPRALFTAARQHEQSSELHERIMLMSTTQQFNKAVVSMAASAAEFINGFSRLVMTWSNQSNVIIWRLFVVDYILDHATISERQFIPDAIDHLSATLRISFDQVHTALMDVASTSLPRSESQFQALLALIDDDKNRVAPADQKIEPTRSSSLDIKMMLRYYLTMGSLPAGVLPAIKSYSAFVKFIQRQLDLGIEELLHVIAQALADEKVRTRVIRNESEAFLFMLIGALYPRQKQKLKTYQGMVTSFFRAQIPDLPRKPFDELFYQTMFEQVLEKDYATYTAEQIIIRFMMKAKLAFGLQTPLEVEVLQRYGFNLDLIHQFMKLSGDDKKLDEWFLAKDIPEHKLDQRVLVKNAGLVIAWPYLSRYFDLLSMTEDSKFKTEEDAARAVHLLQYIATGFASAPEHELLLNKVLCGVKIATPVPIEITLSDKEKEVSAMMLNGLLQNWDRLKGSSIQALQEGFMMREGYLMETDELWQLKVEKKTLDILMENLPWSFGTIKLPWMEKRMIVEWL